MKRRSDIDTWDIQRDWSARGFTYGLWTDPPGQVWEDYVHDTDELFLVIEGKVQLEIHGKTLSPAPGEDILIPAKSIHTVRNVGATTARWLYGYRKG